MVELTTNKQVILIWWRKDINWEWEFLAATSSQKGFTQRLNNAIRKYGGDYTFTYVDYPKITTLPLTSYYSMV